MSESKKPNTLENEKSLKDYLISKGFKDNSPRSFTKDCFSVEFGSGYICKVTSKWENTNNEILVENIIDNFKISTVDELLHTFKYFNYSLF